MKKYFENLFNFYECNTIYLRQIFVSKGFLLQAFLNLSKLIENVYKERN